MNHIKIFAYFREQKAFAAFLTTLMVLGSGSAVFAARGAAAEVVFLSVTDTLSTSEPGADATHTIKFTPVNILQGVAAPGSPLDITFAPEFAIPALASSDVTMTASGSTYVGQAICDATAGAFTVTVSSQVVSINLCENTTIATTTPVTIDIGTGANKIANPGAVDDYQIIIDHPSSNQSQKIRVVTVSKVLMTAAVDPILSFTVTGTASGTAVNGVTTNLLTSPSAIDFETLVPGVAKVAAQQLEISTNARNGFNVTARTDSEFKSANGATIDGFNYAGASSTASAWAIPAGTIGDDRTWGHVALTTTDLTNTLPSIASDTWVGNFIQTPVTVFSQAYSTRNQVETVGFKVEVTDLQEAATDYTTNIIYVATPVF